MLSMWYQFNLSKFVNGSTIMRVTNDYWTQIINKLASKSIHNISSLVISIRNIYFSCSNIHENMCHKDREIISTYWDKIYLNSWLWIGDAFYSISLRNEELIIGATI